MFDKVLKLIAAAKKKDWRTTVTIIMDLIKEGMATFTPEPLPPADSVVAALHAKSTDALVAQLESMTVSADASSFGDKFKVLLPILMEMLKKYLGF